MSFLPEVAKRLRKPLREGRGIKVFQIQEDVAVGTRVKLKSGRVGKVKRKLTHFSDETPFYKVKVAGQKSPSLLKQHEFEIIKEGWGPEDILQDMMEDEGIRRLVKDIKKLLRKGTPLNDIAASIQHLEDAASTRLTVEERTVLLKHLEKNERRLKGPKRGLEAYNKRMRKFQLPGAKTQRQYTTKHQRPIKEGKLQPGTPIRIGRESKTGLNDIAKRHFGRKGVIVSYFDQYAGEPPLYKVQVPGRKSPLHLYVDEFVVIKEDVSSIFVHQIRSLFNKFKNGEILYSDAMRQVDELTKDRGDADKWRAALHSLRNVNEGQMDTIRITKLRDLVSNIERALDAAYTSSDANDASEYYAALNSADKHIEAHMRKYGSGKITRNETP